jgi:energy-coupling factor transport system ATP-binding protein
VFQDPRHQFLTTTVADELDLGPRRAGLPEDEIAARREDLLGRLRLAHLARANPFTLSGGEQRRLSVATVLATRPRLLVLDEPTFGQDARTWAELVALLRGLTADGAALVVATHDEDLVPALDADLLPLKTSVGVP